MSIHQVDGADATTRGDQRSSQSTTATVARCLHVRKGPRKMIRARLRMTFHAFASPFELRKV